MAGASRAHLFIGGIRRVPARVSHGRGDHAGNLPELALRAPEAAEAEYRLLEATDRGLLDGAAVDEVFAADRQRRAATGQRLVVRRHGGLLAEESHGNSWIRFRGLPQFGVGAGITQDRPKWRFIAAKLRAPMTESASTPRLRATFAIYLGLVVATAALGPREVGAGVYYVSGIAGFTVCRPRVPGAHLVLGIHRGTQGRSAGDARARTRCCATRSTPFRCWARSAWD